MLFRQGFHESIARGEITVAYRIWDRPRVKAGGRYRVGAIGSIDVTAMAMMPARELTDADAHSAGYNGRDELLAELSRYADVTDASPLTVVRFQFVPGVDPRSALSMDATLSDADRASVTKRLDRMDATSPHGAWTRKTLALIAEHPRRRAGDLADMLGRERLDFKKDVRRLKALGLTISHEVGYEISPRGQTYLDGASQLTTDNREL